MKRKWFYFAVLIILLILQLFSQRINREPDYLSVMEANWDISFPSEAQWEEIYQTDSGPSFHGDGWRYHIFSYQQEDVVADIFPWSQEAGETIFSESYREASESWLDAINVPNEQRPDYDNCLVWYTSKEDNSQILIFWNQQAQIICAAENFI